jgi:hypothetical protein
MNAPSLGRKKSKRPLHGISKELEILKKPVYFSDAGFEDDTRTGKFKSNPE